MILLHAESFPKHVRVFEKTRTYTPLLGEDILQVP